ncbi:Peptidoglycan/LPS O-acetylase OafA/YrhL, contains acyltransferase and SGNH-hydrolase domains [Pseudoxanthobacter soli DSM 19599]|uniref:Peptidoglycan/LPS O-acetylase OafA/YrhL, contains acyltransferase and SGNH-hydrolase domains n=1 Tax=Pseudoxanthobacter soli DSM 19599 TaxID=1123029 RepID=A0A1M7ZLM5_9HYPH|nr:acyltransferase [Pseudoxanthobacter soli]SHO65712.1 Peptidoglycan/LPS O-acetylase OafA/YrhL, contains acyltransferase and SGNH-hydrolase domains [Pseudoxanthobacter soli DSM 19599]
MGLIRIILALSVVFAHSGKYIFVGGQYAVQLFYIISGFLISYIIVERKRYNKISLFYLNRFLRLYPIYWFVAIITLALYACALLFPKLAPALMVTPDFFKVYREVGVNGLILLVFSNIALFGQDWVMFTGVREGVFRFVTDFRQSELPVWNGLLVPQAWTLGVELTFYLVAPFLLHRTRLVISLAAASVVLRILLIQFGPGGNDPWTYRFFPTELALFLGGALSHQFLRPAYERWLGRRYQAATKIATALVVLICVLFFTVPVTTASTLALFAAFLLGLPFLFSFQVGNALDRKIGDLSYPVYISHMIVIAPARAALDALAPGLTVTLVYPVTVAIVTLAISYVIEKYLGDPLEAIRSRIRRA